MSVLSVSKASPSGSHINLSCQLLFSTFKTEPGCTQPCGPADGGPSRHGLLIECGMPMREGWGVSQIALVLLADQPCWTQHVPVPKHA